jgi:hypothetical protein
VAKLLNFGILSLYFNAGCSVAEVKLELNREEMEDAKNGVLPMHEVSPVSFLVTGLELEDLQ